MTLALSKVYLWHCVEMKITQYSIAYFDHIDTEAEKGHSISAILAFSRRTTSAIAHMYYIIQGSK